MLWFLVEILQIALDITYFQIQPLVVCMFNGGVLLEKPVLFIHFDFFFVFCFSFIFIERFKCRGFVVVVVCAFTLSSTFFLPFHRT